MLRTTPKQSEAGKGSKQRPGEGYADGWERIWGKGDFMNITSKRYQIYDGSKSAHCCFVATVVDTTSPHMIGGEHYRGGDGQLHYFSVCECFSYDDAVLICDALNAMCGEEE